MSRTCVHSIWIDVVDGVFCFLVKVQREVVAEETEEQEADVCGGLVEQEPVGIDGLYGSVYHSPGEEELEQVGFPLCLPN